MKQAVTTILIAAVVSGLVVQAYRIVGSSDGMAELPAAASESPASAAPAAAGQVPAAAGRSLSFTDALVEDVWIDAARTAGDDHRSLTNADNSICFITKIELSGIQGPDDTSSCRMEIDDFTGFWDLVAEVEEGGQSAIRCNARCLIWE